MWSISDGLDKMMDYCYNGNEKNSPYWDHYCEQINELCNVAADLYNDLQESSRRLVISWLADLSHHRTYGSVYGGSLVFTYFQIKLCECRISKFTEFLVVKCSLQHEISAAIPVSIPHVDTYPCLFLFHT